MTESNRKQIAPKLRFRSFVKEWNSFELQAMTPMNEKYGIVDGPFGSNLKTIHYTNEGIPIITSGYVTNGFFYADEYLYVTKEKFQQEKRSAVKAGDIVMAKIGARCGASAILPKDHPIGILSGNALKITIDETRFSTQVVWQILLNLYNTHKIDPLRTVGAQPAISIANLKKFRVNLPTLPEQQKIASFLSATDEKIQQLTRKKKLLEQYKRGVMQQLFSGKLRFKDEHGKAYPKWEEKKLGPLVQIKSGVSPSNFKLNDNGVYPFFKVEELNNSEKYQIRSRFYTNSNDGLIERNSIIFPKRGAAILNNKVRITKVDSLMDTNLMALTPVRGVLNFEYLYYKIFAEKLYKIADTSSIPQINNKHIEPYKIPLPCLEEQQKIASFLSSLDTKIESVATQITQSQTFKKGLLQQMFV